MNKRTILFFFTLFFWSCSSSHQISFSVPPPEANSAKRGVTVGIYAPDSLKNFVYSSTLSGGLCGGHEFDLHIGSGIIEAMKIALESAYDTVIMLNAPTAKLEDCFIPVIEIVNANADFSATAFSVMIKGSVNFRVQILDIPNEREKRMRDVFKDDIKISAENSGKGQDCHDAVPYLKKSGDVAMLNLRDSVTNRLSSAGLVK
jgi:hypothetical protein